MRCIGISCTVRFAMIPTWQPPEPHEKSRDNQAESAIGFAELRRNCPGYLPIGRRTFFAYGQAPREYAVTLSKSNYITSERWGRCPYLARFVGLAKSKLAVKYDDYGHTCNRLRSG